MTYPIVTCLLVAAICCAIASYIFAALIIVGVAMALEFYLPGVGLTEVVNTNVRADTQQTD